MLQNIKFNETKLVTITRGDLNKDGYIIPQTSHAIADFAYQHPDTFSKWKEESNSIVCLEAESEEHLFKLYEKYSHLTPIVKFFEPDIDEWTSICLYATPKIRKSLSHLPLAGKKSTKVYEKTN